jgi:hypothetical protein
MRGVVVPVAGAVLAIGAMAGPALAAAAADLPGAHTGLAGTGALNTQTFGFNDQTQYFTVPAGVSQVRLIAWGGCGGYGGWFTTTGGQSSAQGGDGTEISANAAVSPGDILVITPGGCGASSNGYTGGAGGLSSGNPMNGGSGGNGSAATVSQGAGGGGGGTEVVDNSTGAIQVAAGGGGGGGAGSEIPGDVGGTGGTNGNGGNGVGFEIGYGGGLAVQNGPAGQTGADAGQEGGGGGGGGGGTFTAQYQGGGGGASAGTSAGGGGGGAGGSYTDPSDTNVVTSNGPYAQGGVTVEWNTPAPTVTVTSRPAKSFVGQSVTLIATLTPQPGSSTGTQPTGTVTFVDQTTGATLGTSSIGGSPDTGLLALGSIPLGTNHIVAVYSGDANFPGATSAPVTQTVTKAPKPVVTKLAPASAQAGAWIVIDGKYFFTVTKVLFGTKAAGIFIALPTGINVIVPPGSGTVNVRVITDSGESAQVSTDRFTYTKG